MSMRQPRGPRSSSQAWKLPSSCTSSPKCDLRSLRWQCFLRFRCRLHNPSRNIQSRKVSWSKTSPSSSAKCSSANVGPNLSSSDPEYLVRIKCNTRRRSFSGLLRFDGRPALPCFSPWLPTRRYRRHNLFVCRWLSSSSTAASFNVSSPLLTRPITSTRFSSPLLMAVLVVI